MSKINVFIENNEKELRFDTCIVKPAGSVMTLKMRQSTGITRTSLPVKTITLCVERQRLPSKKVTGHSI